MEPYNSTDTCDTSESCNDYPFLRDDSGDVCNFDDHQFTDISIPPIANILQLLNDRASRQIRPSKSKLSRLEKSNANRAKYLAAVQYLLVCGNDDIGVITSQATNGDVRIFFTMRDYKSTSDPGKVDIQPDGKLFRACRFLYDNRDLSFKGHTEALTEIVSQGPPGFGYWTQLYQYALHQSAPKILKRMDSTGYHGNYFDSLAKINTSRFMKYPNQTIPRWTADDAACIKWAFSIMDPEERSTYPYLENCCDPYTFNFFRSPKVIASIMQEYHRLIMSFLNMFKDAMTELNQSEEDYSMREFERLLMKANDIEKCLGTMAWKSHFFHWFIRTYLRRDLRQPKQEETTFSSDRYPSTFLEARMESARISCFPEQLIAWLRLVTSSGYYVGKVTQYHRKYRPLSIAYSFINYPATNADSEDLWDSLISTICINGEKAFDEEELMEAFTNSA